MCKERLFSETASIFLEGDAFYEDRREPEDEYVRYAIWYQCLL